MLVHRLFLTVDMQHPPAHLFLSHLNLFKNHIVAFVWSFGKCMLTLVGLRFYFCMVCLYSCLQTIFLSGPIE